MARASRSYGRRPRATSRRPAAGDPEVEATGQRQAQETGEPEQGETADRGGKPPRTRRRAEPESDAARQPRERGPGSACLPSVYQGCLVGGEYPGPGLD